MKQPSRPYKILIREGPLVNPEAPGGQHTKDNNNAMIEIMIGVGPFHHHQLT